MTGVIKTLRPADGYGFVTGDDGVDRFFHRTFLAEGLTLHELKPGQGVEFTPSTGPGNKGPRAIDVKIADRPILAHTAPTVPTVPTAPVESNG